MTSTPESPLPTMSEEAPLESSDHSQLAWHVGRRVFGFALPHWKLFVAVFLLTGVYTASNSMRVLMVGLLFDGVLAPMEVSDSKSKAQRFFDYFLPFLPELRQQESRRLNAVAGSIAGGRVERLDERSAESQELEDGSPRWSVTIVADVEGRGEISLQEGDGTSYLGPFQRVEMIVRNRPPLQLGQTLDPPWEMGPARLVVYKGDAGGTGVLPILYAFGILIAVLAVIIAVSNFFKLFLTQAVTIRTIAAIRQRLFEHFSTLSLDYFGGSRRGDLISRLTNDVASIQLSLRYLFGDLVQHPMTIFFSLGLAFYASWQLTLIALPFLPLLVLPVLRSGRKVKKHGRGSLEKLGEVTETFSQFLSGIRVVKAFRMEHAQKLEFDEKNDGFIRSNLKMVRAKSTSRSAVEGLYNLLAALMLMGGGWLLVGGAFDLEFSDFAVFLGAIMSLYQPLKVSSRAYNTIQESLAGAERVFELLDERPTVVDHEAATPFPPLSKGIEFHDVSFRYNDGSAWVLHNINLRVEKGQTVALVGQSGAGKSTLLDLLARFYDVVEGEIRIDGRDLRSGTQDSLLAQIAYVGQDPFLFHSRIIDNIRHGRPDATLEEIHEAARAAAVHDEIMEMPKGYDTVIGERGSSLSGGQRQRVTIARALLKNAGILLLDEATSSLDTSSERKVQAALEVLMKGRTTFVIAHRMSTIRDADRILVLDKGRIVEEGSHQELQDKQGAYARLLTLANS